MFNDLSRMGKYLGQAARMLVGMPDYDTYVEHMRNKHPDKPVMTYEEFFRERQEARYGDGDRGVVVVGYFGHAQLPEKTR
ncbi:YbdD/YjiX family protein, partial [Pseudomonas aeruginosa]|nr:YbdD/YjiX family protein [Pseudomonas aeruginosa]